MTRSDVFYARLSDDVMRRMVTAALGGDVHLRSWRELHGGLYNLTYLVELDGCEHSRLVLRAGPPAAHELHSESRLLENEVAVLPLLADLSVGVPQTIAYDGTRAVLDRAYALQTVVDGEPAIPVLRRLSTRAHAAFYTQLGRITREVHALEGPGFGAVLGATHARLAGAVVESLDAIAADCRSLGLDDRDLTAVTAWVDAHAEVFDRAPTPRLLAGDLGTPNLLVDPDASAPPIITGAVDFDRAWWGDPAADWTIRMAHRLDRPDRDAFCEGYGALEPTGHEAAARSLVYEARHLGAVLLERSRLGAPRVRVDDTRAALGATRAALESV